LSAVVISYRRDDTAGWAERLARGLADKLGADKVFMDVNALEPGVDYADVIKDRIHACDIVLVIIGPGWLDALDKLGSRRLDNKEDLLRLEVAMALSRNIPVIPVLVGGAVAPSSAELPSDIQGLARRNAYSISSKHWDIDLAELLSYLHQVAVSSPAERTFANHSDQSGATDEAFRPVDHGVDGYRRNGISESVDSRRRTEISSTAGGRRKHLIYLSIGGVAAMSLLLFWYSYSLPRNRSECYDRAEAAGDAHLRFLPTSLSSDQLLLLSYIEDQQEQVRRALLFRMEKDKEIEKNLRDYVDRLKQNC
jgi:hypothetical protein